MSYPVDCPACVTGNHDDHEASHGGTKGVIGGVTCDCDGSCAEREAERQKANSEWWDLVTSMNKKAFEKESEFSILHDNPPHARVDQDLRSKNRFREHSGGEHLLEQTEHRESKHWPGHFMYVCACGWVGWLIPKED